MPYSAVPCHLNEGALTGGFSPSPPQLFQESCQASCPPPGLGNSTPAVPGLVGRIQRQRAELREQADSWIAGLDQLLADLLVELPRGEGKPLHAGESLLGRAEGQPGSSSCSVAEGHVEQRRHEAEEKLESKCCAKVVDGSAAPGHAIKERRGSMKFDVEEIFQKCSAKASAIDQQVITEHSMPVPRPHQQSAEASTNDGEGPSCIKQEPPFETKETDGTWSSSEPIPEQAAKEPCMERHRERASQAWEHFIGGRTIRTSNVLGNAVRSPHMEKAVAVMICLSSVLVGIEVEIGAEEMRADPPVWLEVTQTVFSVGFFLELALRWWAEGPRFLCHYVDWQWNVFDTVVVAMSIVDKVSILVASGDGHPLLLLSRMIRIVRIVRIIRVVRFLRELKLMILSIFCTLKSLIWSLVLMVLILYLFAAYLTQATTDHVLSMQAKSVAVHEDLLEYWGTMPRTTLTLFLCMSGGVSWGEPLKPLLGMHWTVVLVFLVYISFVLFAFLNVITGFFCVSASDVTNLDKEQIIAEQLRNKSKYTAEFRTLFKMMDLDHTGVLGLQDFQCSMEDPRVVAYFSHLNLDIDQAWGIFKLLDVDLSGSVSIDEFVAGCLKLRGAAKSVDIAALCSDMKKLKYTLSEFIHVVQQAFEEKSPAMPARSKVMARAMSHGDLPRPGGKPKCKSEGCRGRSAPGSLEQRADAKQAYAGP